MMKDSTEFRQRFADWKAGKKVYDAGKPITDDEYYSIMERVAKENWQSWGDPSEDAALTRILNANDYDYRGYYDKYPESKANADTHWTDEFKTVYHPTFSKESRYSGKKSKFNPEGLVGGSWGEDDKFYPLNWQQFDTKGYPRRILPKYDGGTDDEQYYTLNELANIYKNTDTPFVVLSGGAYVPKEYWDAIQNYPEEVQHRVKEINDGLSEGVLDINGPKLKEVVVTPTKTDKKILRLFKRAVPDKNVRNDIYKEFDHDLDVRMIYGDKAPISENDRVRNLVAVWQMSKNPKIYNTVFDRFFKYPKSKALNNISGGQPRPIYLPILNRMGNIEDFSDYVSELSHAYQYSSNADKSVRENLLSTFFNLPGDISVNGKTGYERPGNIEHTAHSIIQPALEDFIMTERSPSVQALNNRIKNITISIPLIR